MKISKLIGTILLAPLVLLMLIFTISFSLVISIVGFPFLIGLMLYQDTYSIEDFKNQYFELLDFALFPIEIFKGE